MATKKEDPFEKVRLLNTYLGKVPSQFQAYAGTDIKAVMYLPLLTNNQLVNEDKSKVKVFADLQTISISSTRSISPVRVLGRSSPVGYTRGARTVAGTMVFASINTDAFRDIYDTSVAESMVNSSSSLTADQLPPFSIVLVAANESGAVAMQAIHGITLVNYGTNYSIDDLYSETVYSYVAEDVVPLTSDPAAMRNSIYNSLAKGWGQAYKSISTNLEEAMKKAYGRLENIGSSIRRGLDKEGRAGADRSYMIPKIPPGFI